MKQTNIECKFGFYTCANKIESFCEDGDNYELDYNMGKTNVVSLFNGMNTGRQALENVGIKVGAYYSSEIKPYAIELTQHHFPDTIQVGDVTKWREWDIDWKTIDLVLSGSPCQDLSAAGKRAGIEGKKSSLFFIFIEILEHIKILNPNVLFFQENVGSANKLDVGIMSRALGVYPVRINSELLVAASRDRYYWSNIKTKETMFDIVTDIPQPKDKGIMFKDILTSGYTDRKKARAILESEERPLVNKEKLYKRYKELGMINLVFDNAEFMPNENLRILNKIELCRLQGFSDDYCDILTRNKAASLLGDGWTLPIIEHIFNFIEK
jgi:site-specific DNA-cytosine methylase